MADPKILADYYEVQHTESWLFIVKKNLQPGEVFNAVPFCQVLNALIDRKEDFPANYRNIVSAVIINNQVMLMLTQDFQNATGISSDEAMDVLKFLARKLLQTDMASIRELAQLAMNNQLQYPAEDFTEGVQLIINQDHLNHINSTLVIDNDEPPNANVTTQTDEPRIVEDIEEIVRTEEDFGLSQPFSLTDAELGLYHSFESQDPTLTTQSNDENSPLHNDTQINSEHSELATPPSTSTHSLLRDWMNRPLTNQGAAFQLALETDLPGRCLNWPWESAVFFEFNNGVYVLSSSDKSPKSLQLALDDLRTKFNASTLSMSPRENGVFVYIVPISKVKKGHFPDEQNGFETKAMLQAWFTEQFPDLTITFKDDFKNKVFSKGINPEELTLTRSSSNKRTHEQVDPQNDPNSNTPIRPFQKQKSNPLHDAKYFQFKNGVYVSSDTHGAQSLMGHLKRKFDTQFSYYVCAEGCFVTQKINLKQKFKLTGNSVAKTMSDGIAGIDLNVDHKELEFNMDWKTNIPSDKTKPPIPENISPRPFGSS